MSWYGKPVRRPLLLLLDHLRQLETWRYVRRQKSLVEKRGKEEVVPNKLGMNASATSESPCTKHSWL